MAIPILLIAIAGGCRPNNIEPENPIDPIDKPDDRPDGPGDKPEVPTDEYYKGWNTTGEYLVPEETDKVNPNLFLTEDEDVEVVSVDPDNLTAVIRFKKDVPKLYRGALLIIDLSEDDDDTLIYVKHVEMNGNEATIQFRGATIGELFFNRKVLLTTNPNHEPVGPDVEVFTVEVVDGEEEEATKAEGGFLGETPFFNLQKTYELFDPKVTSTSFNTKFELSLDYYFDTEKPKSGKEAVDGDPWENWDEENQELLDEFAEDYTEADMHESYVYLDGYAEASADVKFDVNLNNDFDMFEKKLRIKEWKWHKIKGHIGVVKITIKYKNALDAKINCGVQGTFSTGAHLMVNSRTIVGASYSDEGFKPQAVFSPGKDYKFDTPKIKSCEADIKIGPELEAIILAYGVCGLKIQPFLFFGAKYTGKKIENSNQVNEYYGFSGEHSFGADCDATVVVRRPISGKIDELAKWPKHEPIIRKTFHSFPEKIEPKQKDLSVYLDYRDKWGKELDEETRMCIWDRAQKEEETPSKGALVRVQTLSTMPPDTKGTFQTKEGKTCHDEQYFYADDLGEVVVDFEVPGPMQYDYTFRADIIDGEGKEIRTNTIYPLNRMKSYTATYSASECDGETILTIDDYGKKITEKGEFTRVVVYDGYPIQATYIVDSDFPELFEMGDFEFTGSMGYVTYYMKYYAGECLFDPVLDNLDYIRWDRDMNNNHLDFIFNEEDFGDLEDCVHVTGPECSVFFPHTDITYWMNIPVKVATGYLDPEQKHYSYLTLKSYKILDDSSEDRAKKDGDTEYEPNPTVPMEALDDEDGTWGDFIGGGGGDDDDDDLAGYYVRVNEEPESWEGKYLIVDEKSQNFFLSNINGIYNTFNGAYTGSLNNGRISTSTMYAADSYFTVSKLSDGSYSILSKKGYYIGCEDSTNATFDKWAEEPIPNTITYDTVNKCVLIQGYYNHTLCYDERWGQFIYSTWADYSAGTYHPVQLYKLHE